MTNNEAREYFAKTVGSYHNITEGDIDTLIKMLRKEIAVSKRDMSIGTLYLSRKVRTAIDIDGSIRSCFLFINSDYFTQRECISFNADGFIGFMGWADSKNTEPILRAFCKWCDEVRK